jgi:hypothetical protein
MRWKVAGYVFASGALGGLASWCVQLLIGATPYNKPFYVVIPSLLVVGGISAIFGVYLLANSDTDQLVRTLAFAVACGVFWQPVIDSARNFVSQTAAASQAASLQTASQELGQLAASNDRSVRPKVVETSQRATELLQKLPALPDPNLKATVVAETTRAVDQIDVASAKAPDASVPALQQIGVAAVKSGQTTIARHVLRRLDDIASRDPKLADQVKAATSAIIDAAQQPAQELSTGQK